MECVTCWWCVNVKRALAKHINLIGRDTAYLHGEVAEDLYMDQPEFFNDGSGRVCKLKKAIYGLKQAGRLWNLKLDKALANFGLKKSKLDPCIYYTDDREMIVAIYVDDFLMVYKNDELLDLLKNYLNETFRMKDAGPVQHCLGVRVVQKNDEIELDQEV